MTTGFFSVLHPTFESLSAYADMPELEAARSRVGRHVSRCEECRKIVEDIRRLGDETRAASLEGAPEGLWSRITSAAAVVALEDAKPRETPPPDAPSWESAPSLRPTRHWPIPARKTTRIGLGLAIAAAAAIVAVLAWPTGQSLQASGLSRLTYSPARPAPGGVLNVRYQPPAWLKGAPRLVLVGSYALPSGRNAARWWPRDLVGDSIATLLPARDGSYEAKVRLPSDFLAMQLSVVDSTGEEADTDGRFTWGVIAGERTGSPSLPAMLAAQEAFAETEWGEGAAAHNLRLNVADSLKRYFPSHPAGWAFTRDYGTQKGVFDFLRFFQSAEKRYANLYEKLWSAPSLDADRLHDMVVFAFRIEEPAQAEKWAKRLVREHPEDPRALYDLGRVLHEVELRQPKDLADSIRPWLPIFDSLYRRAPQVSERQSDAMMLVQRYGDSTTKNLWRARLTASDRARYSTEMESDSAVRALAPDVVEALRVEAGKDCTRPAAKFRFFGARSYVVRWCMLERSGATATLAHVALVTGDARAAATLVDSAMALRERGVRCFYGWGSARRTGARAQLALGDTAAAERQLMAGIPPANQDSSFTDFARTALGPRFDAQRWSAARETAHDAYLSCQRQAKAESEAADAKRRTREKL
ncbi:MAG: hypothetical protein JWL61_1260 [Gemmatimonadetes bacterium]|nr:hypothetical protein [Gemmatimonadota bacterium]